MVELADAPDSKSGPRKWVGVQVPPPALTLLPIDQTGANLFFQLISRRYEKGPMILTSNQSFGSWGEIFGDRVIATAILDRILHHAITVNIRGNSYRLKDRLKAGLFQPAEATT